MHRTAVPASAANSQLIGSGISSVGFEVAELPKLARQMS
jgi:hypothetical protein